MENRKERTVTIKIELDTTDAQKKLDEIDEHIRNSEAFRVLNGEVFIKAALIQDAKISNAIESTRPVVNTYNISMGKLSGNEPVQNTVTNTSLELREKVLSIVAGYMSGAASEYTEELVDELMKLLEQPEDHNEQYRESVTFTADKFRIHSGVELNVESSKKTGAEDIVLFGETLNDLVREVIRKESKPGGFLWRLKRE